MLVNVCVSVYKEKRKCTGKAGTQTLPPKKRPLMRNAIRIGQVECVVASAFFSSLSLSPLLLLTSLFFSHHHPVDESGHYTDSKETSSSNFIFSCNCNLFSLAKRVQWKVNLCVFIASSSSFFSISSYSSLISGTQVATVD